MTDLVLTSTSPARRLLLKRLGVPFRCLVPTVREDDWTLGDWGPRELAEHLAKAKAESLRAVEPNSTLIGGDQVVILDGRIYGKPDSVTRAVEQLEALNGKSHELITALAVWHDGQTFVHTDVATMTMRTLTLEEIERYVAADKPIECAGSYKIEERGITLFERIQTHDYTAIMGLPLIALTGLLRRLGHSIP